MLEAGADLSLDRDCWGTCVPAFMYAVEDGSVVNRITLS